MKPLPVVERELRVAARRRALYRVRWAAALASILFGGGALWSAGAWTLPATLGRQIFNSLSMVAFLLCLLAGPVLTADAVSEEKREGTLGLLFLTDLRGWDVILGKLTATSVVAALGLLAIVPVLALSVMLGGVAFTDVCLMTLVLANTLFFSLAIGLLVSSFCYHSRSAFAVSTFVLLLLGLVLPVLSAQLGPRRVPVPLPRLVRVWSPTLSLGVVRAFSGPGQFSTAPWWLSLTGTHFLAWCFLLWASRRVSRTWREPSVSPLLAQWKGKWLEYNFGKTAERRQIRLRTIEKNPILWLSSRDRAKRSAFRFWVGLSLVIWLMVLFWLSQPYWDWAITMMLSMLLCVPLKWLMASEASYRWATDRRCGMLELILTTPLTVREILHGHMRSLRRLFALPACALIAVTLLTGLKTAAVEDEEVTMFTIASLIVFPWDLHTLAWWGTWQGLAKPNAQRAFVSALAPVLVAPWLIFMILQAWLQSFGRWTPVLWLLICGSVNVTLYLLARFRLSAELRLAAAEPFAAVQVKDA